MMKDTNEANDEPLEVQVLRRENEALRCRIVELEKAQLAHEEEVLTLCERLQLLQVVVHNSPSVIFVKDLNGRYILVNQELANLYGTTCEQLIGLGDGDFFPAEAVQEMRVKDAEAINHDGPLRFEETVPFEGDWRHYVTIKFRVTDLEGTPTGVCGIASEVTEQRRQEAERLRMREEIIAAQEAALRELSTPLMPIAEGVVAMPLVGAIDAKRAELILTALLDGVSQQQAHTVIMDITGVRKVDAQVAEALVNAARSVRLLGARVIVTGVRPEVARTLVDLGTNLEGILTRSTLRSGIASALGRQMR